MFRYTNESLLKYCYDNSIELLEDYNEINIKRDNKIKGKCINCNNEFNKSFRAMIETGATCNECSIKNGIIKQKNKIIEKCKNNPQYLNEIQEKYKKTCLEKYGVDNAFKSEEIKNKIKETNIEKYGVEHVLKSEIIKDKMKKTNLEKYGVENPFQSEECKEKSKQTCLEKYGREYAMQNKIIQDKVKETCLEKYGTEYASQNQDIINEIKKNNLTKYGVETALKLNEFKEKSKQTCLEKYGVDNPMKCKEIKEKANKTNLNKYGVENPFQSEECKEKAKQTCLKKYGVEHGMQNKEIFDKSNKNSYKLKTYTFPSGNEIKYQGYENYALDELIQNYEESNIITGVKNVPTIWYTDESGKKHRHYVDIFIPTENKCIEVKSTWTFKKKKDNVLDKMKCAKDQGYLYEIWVYDNKGNKVETI